MNIFKKKSLCAALAGIGALGAAGAAQAVNLNPDGLGQVLIYPYYTTRADANGNVYNSLLSVVNTTASVKAVKVRFLESLNSQEVLDFNLFLSPRDVWTAAITPDDSTGGAKVATADTSCTLPNFPAGGVSFVNFQYASGDAADGADPSFDRTKEGYVEIIEMATYSPGSDTAVAVTHDPPGGSPPGPCDASLDASASSEALPPGGGLMGGITLINVNAGADYTADAVALDNFSDTSNYSTPDSVLPNLNDASPPISVVFANNAVFTSLWTVGIDAVSAVLMHDHVMNEYVLDAGTLSGTDWVLTMPTKRFYVAVGTGPAAGGLFQRNFNGTAGSCDDVSLNIFDREEKGLGGGSTIDFSPRPPGAPPSALCWEANVITFNQTNVLGSPNSKNITTTNQNGWLDLSFLPASVTSPVHNLLNFGSTIEQLVGGNVAGPFDATYVGLPVIGFTVQSFTNGAVMVGGSPTLSNYGGNFVNKGTRRIDLD
jgi:hypothetical protein